MNKKFGLLSLMTILSLGLASCKKPQASSSASVSPSASPSEPSQPSASPSSEETKHVLSLTIPEGEHAVGDVVPLSLSYDNSPLTKAELATATFSANDSDAMTFQNGAATLKKAGTFTITAAYEGIEATASIEVKDVDYSIKQITGAMDGKSVKVRGTVGALTSKGFLLDDGEAAIYVFGTKTKVNKGDFVEVSGSVKNYYGTLQIINPSVKPLTGKGPNLQTPTELTGDKADSFAEDKNSVDNPLTVTENKAYTFTALAQLDGKYTYFNVGTSKAKIEPLALDTSITFTKGTYYTVTGYRQAYNSSFDYIQFIVVSAEKQEYATSVKITGAQDSLIIGSTLQLGAMVSPDDLTDKSVTWSSSDDSIATVDATGLVKALKEGDVDITAKAKTPGFTGEVSDKVTIHVTKESIPATGITLDKTEDQTIWSTKTLTLKATVSTESGKPSTDAIAWTSSDDKIATVEAKDADTAIVTPVATAAGEVTITAKTGNFTASVKVIVKSGYGTKEAPLSVSEAKEAFKGLSATTSDLVYVKGIIASEPTYRSDKKNYITTIKDVSGASMTVYGYTLNTGVTDVYTNDIAVFQGYMKPFNGDLQLTYSGKTDPLLLSLDRGNSALTVTGDEDVTITWADGFNKASVLNGSTVSFKVAVKDGYILDSVSYQGKALTAADGNYSFTMAGDSTLAIASHKKGEAAAVTVTKKASEFGLASGTELGTRKMDAVIEITGANGTNKNNAPKYYTTNGTSFRFYIGNTFTISVGSGYDLQSVCLTLAKPYKKTEGFFQYGSGKKVVSGESFEVSGQSVTFTQAGASGTQVWISEISVTYKAVSSSSVTTVSTADELKTEMAKGGELRLGGDLTVGTANEDPITPTADTTIDLDGHTLNLTKAAKNLSIDSNHAVTIKNGTLVTGEDSNEIKNVSAIDLTAGTLTLDGVTYTCNKSSGILMKKDSHLTVKNGSKITSTGYYAISGNASEGAYPDSSIDIEDSEVTVTTSDSDNCAIMSNIGSSLTLKNSTISYGRQGLMVRGGTATLDGVTFKKTGKFEGGADRENGNFVANGNEVPQAALFLGNGGTGSYNADSSVTFAGMVTFDSSVDTTKIVAAADDIQNVSLATGTFYAGDVKVYDFRSADSTKTFKINGTDITGKTHDGTSKVTIGADGKVTL